MSTFAFKHTYKGIAKENTDKVLFSNSVYNKLEYITINIPLTTLSSMISFEDSVKCGLIRLNISQVIQQLDCLDNLLLHAGQTFTDDASMITDSILKSISEIQPPDSILNFIPASAIKASVTTIISDDLATLFLSGPISNVNSRTTESALTNLLFQLKIANLITLGNTHLVKNPQFTNGDNIILSLDYTPKKSLSFSLDTDIAGVGNILQTDSIKIGGRTIQFGKTHAINADGAIRYLKIKFVGVQNFTTSVFLYPSYSALATTLQDNLRFIDDLDMIVRIESERLNADSEQTYIRTVLSKIDQGFSIISSALRLTQIASPTTWYATKYNSMILRVQQRGQTLLPDLIQEYERLSGFLISTRRNSIVPDIPRNAIMFPSASINTEIGAFNFKSPSQITEVFYFPDPSNAPIIPTPTLQGVINFVTASINSEIGGFNFRVPTQTIGAFYFP